MSLKRCCLVCFLCLACVRPGLARTSGGGQVLLVIPARYTVVQFAFDIARMRSVYLAAYDTEGKDDSLVLHVWDSEAREWVRTNLDEYRSGAIFLTKPKSVVIVGTGERVPAGIGEASSWGGKVRQVSTLGIADMANALHAELSFDAAEWRWLARRYGLKLQDRNAERRRYGRYGPPGSRRERPVQKNVEEDVVMPRPVVEKPVMEEKPFPSLKEVPVEEKGVPAVVIEEKGLRPAPVVEEKGVPAPVIEEKGVPAPLVEEKGLPEPVLEEKGKPVPAPLPDDIAPEDK